jgi:hypothetical protein
MAVMSMSYGRDRLSPRSLDVRKNRHLAEVRFRQDLIAPRGDSLLAASLGCVDGHVARLVVGFVLVADPDVAAVVASVVLDVLAGGEREQAPHLPATGAHAIRH